MRNKNNNKNKNWLKPYEGQQDREREQSKVCARRETEKDMSLGNYNI